MSTSTPATERGTLTISERAVERTATAAIAEVDAIGGPASRVLGVAVGPDGVAPSAKVAATVSGDTAALAVRLSVAYPAPVARTTGNAREHVTRRVEELTGIIVSRVDITVTTLRAPATETRRVQ
jgi:uncharacterized alkaline shock family protein YloU